MTYDDLVRSFRDNPREISTAPTTRVAPKWFRVYEHNGALYVASGRDHPNACDVNPDRRLRPSEFQAMREIYARRERGESAYPQAKSQSINSSYWFGIFKDMKER